MKICSRLSPLVLTSALFVLNSCIESDAVYTLNPDGSGKVEHRVKLTKSAGNWQDEQPDKSLAMNLVRGAEGIEAWTDVNYRMTDGGNVVEFVGTGYFPDVSQVNLGRSRDTDGSLHQIPIPRLVWTRDEKGAGTITVHDNGNMDADLSISVNGKPIDEAKEASEKEDTEEKEEDENPLRTLFMAKLVLDSTYRSEVRFASGRFSNSRGFEEGENGNTAVFVQDPKEMIKGGEETEKEKKAQLEKEGGLKAMLKSGGVYENEKLQRVIFDREPPFSIGVEIDEPSFDYEAEVAAADIKITAGERKKMEGWKKLDSLDGE